MLEMLKTIKGAIDLLFEGFGFKNLITVNKVNSVSKMLKEAIRKDSAEFRAGVNIQEAHMFSHFTGIYVESREKRRSLTKLYEKIKNKMDWRQIKRVYPYLVFQESGKVVDVKKLRFDDKLNIVFGWFVLVVSFLVIFTLSVLNRDTIFSLDIKAIISARNEIVFILIYLIFSLIFFENLVAPPSLANQIRKIAFGNEK